MTIYDSLKKKVRKTRLLSFVGFVLFGGNILYQTTHGTKTLQFDAISGYIVMIGILGFGLFLSGIVLLHFGVKCPQCHGSIGQLFNQRSGGFSKSKTLHYCPYCGLDFESDMEGIHPKEPRGE